jgi:L-lactate utilization protein LutC
MNLGAAESLLSTKSLVSIGKSQVALDTETGSEYKLNEVSYDMLEQLSTEKTVEELINVMTQIYNVSKETMSSDCEEWLPTALEKGLVLKTE